VRVTKRMSVWGIAVVLAGAALGSARSYADDKAERSNEPADVDDMRKELKALKAQLQALRATLAEAAELDRQKAALFAKGAKLSGALPLESYAPRAESAAPALESRPAARSGGGAPSLPKKEKVAAATGVLRGKVQVPAGEPVAYVYVENVFASAVRGEKVKIEQVRKQFVPSWAVVQRGTTIEFPNNDNIYHNVFSQSSGNSFDLGLYNSSGAAKSHTFEEPGSVDIFCNIHPQMAASVLVVPNRHFAKVKPNGEFEIADVPVGKRKVVAWAPNSRLNVQWAEVDADGPVDIAFRLEAKSGTHKNKNGQLYGSYQ
jgi:plastocyanin